MPKKAKELEEMEFWLNVLVPRLTDDDWEQALEAMAQACRVDRKEQEHERSADGSERDDGTT